MSTPRLATQIAMKRLRLLEEGHIVRKLRIAHDTFYDLRMDPEFGHFCDLHQMGFLGMPIERVPVDEIDAPGWEIVASPPPPPVRLFPLHPDELIEVEDD